MEKEEQKMKKKIQSLHAKSLNVQVQSASEMSNIFAVLIIVGVRLRGGVSANWMGVDFETMPGSHTKALLVYYRRNAFIHLINRRDGVTRFKDALCPNRLHIHIYIFLSLRFTQRLSFC